MGRQKEAEDEPESEYSCRIGRFHSLPQVKLQATSLRLGACSMLMDIRIDGSSLPDASSNSNPFVQNMYYY